MLALSLLCAGLLVAAPLAIFFSGIPGGSSSGDEPGGVYQGPGGDADGGGVPSPLTTEATRTPFPGDADTGAAPAVSEDGDAVQPAGAPAAGGGAGGTSAGDGGTSSGSGRTAAASNGGGGTPAGNPSSPGGGGGDGGGGSGGDDGGSAPAPQPQPNPQPQPQPEPEDPCPCEDPVGTVTDVVEDTVDDLGDALPGLGG